MVRDLGVHIDSQLRFDVHTDTIVTKSAGMLGFIKRNTKSFKNVNTKILLYNALVRSHLDFASCVWSPFYSTHSQRVESIQRAFTRHLAFSRSGFSHRQPYCERLKEFNMVSLRNRRLLMDMCFLYKTLNGHLHCTDLIMRLSLAVPHRYPRQRVAKLFAIPFARTNLGSQSPLARICSRYNSISASSPDLDIFGNSFSKFKLLVAEYLSGI